MKTALASTGLLIAYVLASATGLALMKQSDGRFVSARFGGGFALYGVGFLLFYVLLTRLPLSVAFPLAAGALMVTTQFSGWFFLGERLGPTHLVGVGLVLAGLVLMSMQGIRA